MTATHSPAQPGLDLGKPIMLPHDKKPWRVVYYDDLSVLVEGGALNARAHHARQYIDEYAENIPPEPPRGPEEVWVSVYHNGFVTWTACASEGAALDMIACVNPARAGAAVRYIRADLATRWNVADRLATVIRELLGRTSGNPIRRCHPVWVEAYAVLADYEAQKSTLTKTKGAQQS